MTIDHDVAATIRRPGRFFQFNIASASRGLVPLSTRVCLIGTMSGAATIAAATPTQVFTEAEADLYWGQGSELALMCRWAIKATIDYGKAPEIWAVGITDPAGTATLNTITATGTATETAELHLRIAGRDVRVGIPSGTAAAAVGPLIDSEIDALKAELPVTSAAVTAVVTTTAVCTGVNGNDVEIETIKNVAGITIAHAQSVPGVGAVDITASLDVLEDKDYDVVCCSNHAAADVADYLVHIATTWGATAKRWRHCLLAERGTIATGQALATAGDDWRFMVVQAEGWRNTCGETAAYVATILAAEDDPALPWNDVELPSLYPPDKADIPTNAELESGISGGMLMLSMNEAQTRSKIVRAVTTKVTHSSVPYFVLLDYSIGKSYYYGARQIDIAQARKFPRAKKTARTLKAVRSVTLDVMYALEDLEIWQKIDDHAAELQVETDAVVTTRINQAVPASVVPPLNQIVNVMNLIVE
jgi:phage tail sheath gpL-like